MLRPDEEFAVGILDALDERCGPAISPFIHDLETRRALCWAEQQCRMLAVLQEWLVRQARQPGCEAQLRRALDRLCYQLGCSRHELQTEAAALERNAGLP